MARFGQRLKRLKGKLRDLNRASYSGIQNLARKALEILKAAQSQMLSHPSSVAAELEAKTYAEWKELAKAEETFWRQKSRIRWLEEGDQNSSFFHRSVVARSAVNGIKRLRLEDDSIITEHADIKAACVEYYTNLLGASSHSSVSLVHCIESLHPFRCSDTQRDCLNRLFSLEEIKAEFFALPSDKAPGPDGYTGEF